MRYWPLTLLVVCGFGCASIMLTPEQAANNTAAVEARVADADVSPRLITLLDDSKLRPSTQDFQQTALKNIITLTTPAGYRLKNRYLELGVPLAQALASSQDRLILQRLVEAARWTSSPRARSEALVSLATFRDVSHVKFFHEALLDRDVAVQFAAVESMQISGLPDFLPILLNAAENNWSPLIRVFSAQALLRLGDARGREKLLNFLTDNNWLVRAMAARYLGDLGQPQDADILLGRIGPEDQRNPYVLAEVCIAAMKLGAQRSPGGAAVPPAVVRKNAATPALARGSAVLELEPLVVSAPRLKMNTFSSVDVRIDNFLTQLLEKVATMPPPDQQLLAPELQDVNNLVTPAGFALKVRYSDLSFLLTEGLSGTRDLLLVQRLEGFAKSNANPRIRALALISLAYSPAAHDIFLYQTALRDANLAVRFGAVEALEAVGGSQVRGPLADAADRDSSMALRVYAAEALGRVGDAQGREFLLRYMGDQDWVIRAMAIHALGELGQAQDYYTISTRLNTESNDFVIAESCYAMLRLAPQ